MDKVLLLLNKILYFVPLSILCLLNAYWFVLDARSVSIDDIIDYWDNYLWILLELVLMKEEQLIEKN